MPHEQHHHEHRRRRRSQRTTQFVESGESRAASQPWLVSTTDACLCLTLILVALGFGGRAAIGQLFLVGGALATTTCWLLHQLTADERKYTWTGSEWLWCLGIGVAGFQIVPLPQSWLLMVSPQLKEILPWVFSPAATGVFPGGWNQLSLAPGETASGLATFASYGLLFLVVFQRVQSLADVERVLCGVALASIAMGGFALLQYVFSNDKFFWTIEHPFMTTSHCALGCFTNRNHLAQFLALGVGPLIWWILCRSPDQELPSESGQTPRVRQVVVLSLLVGLGISVLAILLCYSRGGLLSLGIATIVSLGLLCRMGLASAKLSLGLSVAGVAIAGIFFVTGFETLEKRLEGSLSNNVNDGRFVIWQANIDVTRDFPWLGTGIGTHADAYHLHIDQANEDSLEYTHAECGYLQVASESGLCGLAVALAFIAVSLRVCFRGLRHHDLRVQSVGAAVLGSLLANISHAAFDFFWYTPSCMLLLAIQLAAVARISRSMATTNESDEQLAAWGFRLPRVVTLVSAGSLAAVGCWMLGHKIPAARAEPDRMRYLALSHQSSAQEADDLELAEERGDLLIQAARLDPSDSHLQESAGMEYLRRFDLLQDSSDNPLAFGQIRDVVKASEFDSVQKMKAWMQRAVGSNTRMLQLAVRSYRRALQASPLQAYAYVKLAELGFLELSTDAEEMALLKQALLLRPHDPQVLYQVGRNVMLTGDIEGALAHWRGAFARSRRIQSIIVRQLAPQVEPEFFLKNLKPDWEAEGLVARAYQENGREDDARPIWIKHINEGLKRLKTLPQSKLEFTILSMHDASTALQDSELAIRILNRGLKCVPQSYLIRNRLAWDLYSARRFAEAAEHLRWCASRRPNDKVLQAAAAQAIKESLKTAAAESPTKS